MSPGPSSGEFERDGQLSRSDVQEPSWIKFLVVPGLLLNTIVSTLILVGLQNNWTIYGSPYRTIDNARASTQLVVQIVAGLLGAIYVQTVCNLINFSVRIALTRRPMPLDWLKLWNAITTPTLDWSTPITTLPLVIGFSLLALIPSALWAGALTPVPSSRTFTLPSALSLSRYTPASYSFWSQNIYNNQFAIAVNPKGTFSYIPIQDRFGFLITDGSAATSVNDQPVQHTKNDNSNYTYIGRSYGVGSSVGLTDDATQARYGTMGYQYTETGYQSSVECIYNSSSQFQLVLIQAGVPEPMWETPSLFLATGSGPNTTRSAACAAGNLTDCGGFVTAGLGGDDNLVAAAWWASFESGNAFKGLPRSFVYVNKKRPPLSKAYTSIASGSIYKNLNNTQCSITMVPASFSVDVHTLSRTIKVTPQPNVDNVADIEPSGFIADSASSILGFMSIVDTTLYTSVIGTMLQRNIDNVNQQRNHSTANEQDTLKGVADSLQALIDDHLLATASAQLMVAHDSFPTSATISQQAFSIGQRGYAVAIIVLNALIILCYVFEALRTRYWSQLTQFNYADIKSVIIASSLGVRDAGVTASEFRHSKKSNWFGHSSDRAAGTVRVILRPYESMTLALSTRHRSMDEGVQPHVDNAVSHDSGLPLMEYPADVEGSGRPLFPPASQDPSGQSEVREVRTW
jgi:hypothetical protein